MGTGNWHHPFLTARSNQYPSSNHLGMSGRGVSRDRFFKSWMEGPALGFWNRWSGQVRNKCQNILCLTAEKSQNICCLRAQIFFGAFEPKNSLYLYMFTFHCIFMLNLAPKIIFSLKNAKFFLKSALGAKTLGASCQKLCPYRSPENRPWGWGATSAQSLHTKCSVELNFAFSTHTRFANHSFVCSWSLFTSYGVVFVVLVVIEY